MSHLFHPWVGKTPWRRKWQSTPGLWPRKSHGQRSLVGYSPRGRKESDMTERLHFHPISSNIQIHSNLTHGHTCFTMHTDFYKPILMLKVLIQLTHAHWHAHRAIQLCAHSVRNCPTHPVCTANQPELKGTYCSSHFPCWGWHLLYKVPIYLSPMAPGLSPDAAAVSLPMHTLLAHQLPHSLIILWSQGSPSSPLFTLYLYLILIFKYPHQLGKIVPATVSLSLGLNMLLTTSSITFGNSVKYLQGLPSSFISESFWLVPLHNFIIVLATINKRGLK